MMKKSKKPTKIQSCPPKNFLSDLVQTGQPIGVDDSVMIIQRKLNFTLL